MRTLSPLRIQLLLCFFFLCSFHANASFRVKPHMADSISSSVWQGCEHPVINTAHTSYLRELMTVFAPAHKHKKQSGFLGIFSLSCGVVGLAIASIHTVLFFLLLGLCAGIAGGLGLKAYKHQKGFKALCVIGIILGAILTVLATMPIVFLV